MGPSTLGCWTPTHSGVAIQVPVVLLLTQLSANAQPGRQQVMAPRLWCPPATRGTEPDFPALASAHLSLAESYPYLGDELLVGRSFSLLSSR